MVQKIRLHIFVSGRVQGVNFRRSTKRKAIKSNVKGWVKNLKDSRVEAVLEGDRERVEEVVSWIKEGASLFAKVHDLKVEEEDFTGEFEDFHIKR